ncbi:hypothetical protein ACN28S_18775 [Cystobacter fuscus]
MDAPSRGPAPSAATRLLAPGEPTVDYNLPKVTLTVTDGGNLDQYTSGTINFVVDLQGFEAHPSNPSKVTLKVYDIDMEGSPPTAGPRWTSSTSMAPTWAR